MKFEHDCVLHPAFRTLLVLVFVLFFNKKTHSLTTEMHAGPNTEAMDHGFE